MRAGREHVTDTCNATSETWPEILVFCYPLFQQPGHMSDGTRTRPGESSSASSSSSLARCFDMDTYKILVGSYTNSIYTLEFDPALSGGGTPTLKLISQVDVGHHPSWIDAHPSDRSLIFTRLGRSDRRGQVRQGRQGSQGGRGDVPERWG